MLQDVKDTVVAPEIVTQQELEQETESPPSVESTNQIVESNTTSTDTVGSEFALELFEIGRDRPLKTRSQKQAERLKYATPCLSETVGQILIAKEEMVKNQVVDETLKGIRTLAMEQKDTVVEEGFIYQSNILYRHKRGKTGDCTKQLVVPTSCCLAIMRDVHEIPLGGHLGRKKSLHRIIQRFYWPTKGNDVASFCQSCKPC